MSDSCLQSLHASICSACAPHLYKFVCKWGESGPHGLRKDGKPYFDIQITMEGDIPQLNKPLPEKKMEELAEQQMKKQIMDTYLAGLAIGSDVLLSDKLYRNQPRQWHKLRQNGALILDRDKVHLQSGGISKMKER